MRQRKTLLLPIALVGIASCGYDWDSLEPDGRDVWRGDASADATGGTGGTAGTGGGTAGTGGGTEGTGGGTAGTGGGTAGTGGTTAIQCDEPGALVWSDNGHCYFRVQGQDAGWAAMRSACEGLGAHLVTITSAAEQAFVAGLIDGHDRWTGYSKIGASEFTWITGESSTYENWQQGEPNESGDACTRLRNSGEWADRSCTNNEGAICERE